MVNLLKKYNLHKNSKKREFSGKYSSEKQAFYYELAEKEGINIDDRNLMKNFILEKNKEIFGIIEKTGGKKVEGYYFNAVSEIRQKYGLTKYYNLDFLQKIVNFESNKKAFDELGIVYEDLLKLPKNNILQNEDIKKIKVPRIEDLIESQTDKDFGFVIEWIANGIDVSTPGESIGRFGEGFLQSLEKIDIPGSKIIVSTKSEDSEGYDLHIKKQNGELKFGSLVNDKIESGTSVKIEKKFSEQQIKQIEEIIINKLKTNTKANIILNGKKFNNLTAYKYINGEELNLSGIPTVELKLNENSFEVIDNGKGMSEEVIVKKLLRPNSTGNTRKELSDEEVREATKKETKFFYKKKDSYDEKTNVSLNISGVNIESFEVDTIGNIGDFTFEFPSSSSLKDSRNEIDLSKEVASSMGVSLEKIESKSESLEEKLSLLEIISGIYEKLKDRPTNIVDEEFVLSSVMKTNFFSIRENLEKEGISVLPANKSLVDTIGKADDVFYISEEFVDFDIDNIKAKKEIERVKSVSIKGSLIGEKYKFFEMNFAESSQYDYLVFEGNVFINSKLFTGKSIEEQDKIIHILNTSINLNTSYETDSDRNDYGRILTSKEEFIVKSEKKEKTLIDTNQSVKKKDEPESVLDDEDHEKLQQIKNEILLELDELRKKYGNKLEKFGIFSEFNEDILFLGSEYFILWGDSESKKELEAKNIDYEKIRKSNLFAIKINYLLGLNVYYEITGMDNLTKNSKLFVLINNILNNKSEKITKPYIKFLQKKIGIIGVGAMSMKDLAGISKEIETLNKIIETDPNTATELMGRFEDISIRDIFKDFTEIEEENKKRDNEVLFPLEQNNHLENSYEERLIKKFIDDYNFGDYSEFIDDYLEGSKEYWGELKAKGELIHEDFIKLENRIFLPIFKKYGISGEGIIGNLEYSDIISNYSDLSDAFESHIKEANIQNYNSFREEYIKYILAMKNVNDLNTEENKKIIDRKFINDNFNEGYNPSNLMGYLYFNYILTKNFLDKEEEFEYRIDDTDSIFDEKVGFLLDIIKGLDDNFNYDENVNEGAVKIFMGSGRQEICSNSWDRYLNFIEKFNDIFEDKLLPGNFRKLDWFEKEGGKKLQKQLFEELIKNPDYRDLFIKEKKRVPKKQKIDIFQELSKKYPQDLITFLQFLKSGGEFLKNSELSVEEFSPSMEILHSDLIGLTLHEEDKIVENNSLDFLEELKNKHLDAGFNYKDNRDIIAGVNIAQDSVGMLFLREGTQNSIDAIKRHNEKNPDDLVEEKVKINFYSEQNHFVSSFTDPVGMELKDVIVKLLVPYNSGKDALDDGVGQFGKGFFTFAPDTKQIRIKTSLGDGKVNYLELNPIKINGVVSDFNIKISEKKEEFRGTIIERIDEKKGISGNLRAMIGVNLAKKYIGNIRGVDIEYNGTTLNQQKDIESLSISEDIKGKNKNGNIVNLGSLELLKNNDNISRFTKNDLWISEIKDDLLSDLPDWMKDFFMESNLTVNIPDSIPLLGSRNSLKNREYYIDLLKPYFYKQVVDYTLKSYVSRDFKIPMMPEDYLMLVKYDFGHSSKILNLADRFNSSNEIDFSSNEIEFLKDKEQMRELLVLCNFNLDGELTSLYDIKQQLHRDELEKSKVYQSLGSGFTSKISQAIKLKEDLNKNDNKFNLNFDEIENIVGIEKKEMKEFVTFIYRDFDSLIKKHFGGHFEISFYSGSSGVANSFSNHGNGMAFNINSSIFKNLVSDYRSPEIYEKVIDITTHEMTHNLEGDKWGTHETDEEHPKSFMKIHRGLLRDFVRSI